jgi:branched-chain amino acid transport system substrate-binding protein
MRPRNWIVTSRATFALALASISLPCVARADIVVGWVNALTGPASSLGLQYQKGLAAAPMTVGGEKIRLVVLDDQTDTTTAVKDTHKLIDDDNVDVLISPPDSPSVFAMIPVSHDAHVPLISISTAAVAGEPGDWMIAISQPVSLMVDADIEYMKAHGIHRLAYIGFNDGWGDAVYAAVKPLAEAAGIEIVANERYARADTSVTAQILHILAAKPDAVLEGGSGSPGALPHIALAERGYKGPEFGTHAIISKDFVRIGGAAVEGVIAPTGPVAVADQLAPNDPVGAAGRAFEAAFSNANGGATADAFGAYAFDGWTVFLDAAKRALAVAKPGTPAFRTALRDALVSTKNVVGTHGVYNFTPGQRFGVDDRAHVLVHLVGGKWVLMPP